MTTKPLPSNPAPPFPHQHPLHHFRGWTVVTRKSQNNVKFAQSPPAPLPKVPVADIDTPTYAALVALGLLASAQSTGTEKNLDAVVQLLTVNYAASHPDAKVRYKASYMYLWGHSDASSLSEPHSRSRIVDISSSAIVLLVLLAHRRHKIHHPLPMERSMSLPIS